MKLSQFKQFQALSLSQQAFIRESFKIEPDTVSFAEFRSIDKDSPCNYFTVIFKQNSFLSMFYNLENVDFFTIFNSVDGVHIHFSFFFNE